MRDNNGINKIFLLGQIATEPRLHNGKINEYHFTLVTKELHDKQGAQVEHLEYHQIRLPVIAVPQNLSLRKELTVHIEGKIHTRGWTDEHGVKRYDTEIIAIQFNSLGG